MKIYTKTGDAGETSLFDNTRVSKADPRVDAYGEVDEVNACLGAALSYAFAGVYGRRFKAMGISPLATATGQVSASSLLLLPVMLWVDRPWTLAMPSTGAVAALLGLALLSTVLAYVLFFRILATAGATNLALVTFLIPITAILLGSLLLGEVLEPRHFVGMALIGLGLAAIDGRLLRLFSRRPSPAPLR